MRKFSQILLASIAVSLPLGLVACNDEVDTNDTDAGGSGGGSNTGGGNTDGGNTGGNGNNTGGMGGDSGTGGTGAIVCPALDTAPFMVDDCNADGGPTKAVKESCIGAFKDSATWMDGWTNWSITADGDDVPSAAPTEMIDADIADDMTLDASKVYLLKNKVRVLDGATLTIPAGTIIKGDSATKGTLIISRGGKINAVGTAAKPIVFTSNSASKAPGQWGGIIILGKGQNFLGANIDIEGLDVGDPLTQYGGSDDEDNSGEMKYVRIEFGGVEAQTDKEINGLTLGSVGSGTKISYIQVNTTLDDCFEWFGGTVSADHLICNNGGDDQFDIDSGWRGTMDTIFGASRETSTDTPNGFEWDSDKGASPEGGKTPVTNGVAKNGTICGFNADVGFPSYGALLREQITGSIDNVFFGGWDVVVDTRENFIEVGGTGPKVVITNSFAAENFDGLGYDEAGVCPGANPRLCDDDVGFDEAAWLADGSVNYDE